MLVKVRPFAGATLSVRRNGTEADFIPWIGQFKCSRAEIPVFHSLMESCFFSRKRPSPAELDLVSREHYCVVACRETDSGFDSLGK